MTRITALEANLKKLSSNYSTVLEKPAGFHRSSTKVRKKFVIIKQIAGHLTEVENLLGTISTMLMTVHIVPPIRVTAGNRKRAADKLKKSVTPLRQHADRVEKTASGLSVKRYGPLN